MLLLFAALAVIMTVMGGCSLSARSLFSRQAIARLFSIRAGILLAVAFTEILPEAWSQNHILAGWTALLAFALLFIMSHFAMLDSCPEYLQECHVHYLSWTALLALFSHSFIDGFNLAVSFSAGESAGIAIGLALSLHKIADGFTLMALFAQRYTKRNSLLALTAVAAATPLGSLISYQGLGHVSPASAAALLGFAAGSFIYIAAADILPRLHKNEDKSGLLYFGLGLFGMAVLKNLHG